MKMNGFYLTLLLILGSFGVFAQDSTHVAYSFNYQFIDGVYLNFEQFRNNSPIKSEAILFNNSNKKYDNLFEYIENSSEISFYNELGNLSNIAVKDIWGYCKNGKPYINFMKSFRQIPYIGNICHFVASLTVYYDNNPMYYDPYYYNTMPYRNQSTEVFQMLIDMQTGNVVDFNVENVAILLKRDNELSDEFNSLKKRKKKNMMFYYIRIYNQKHPLYMPITE